MNSLKRREETLVRRVIRCAVFGGFGSFPYQGH
jgi:hypothetical protein